MPKLLAIASPKGGVGKTTTAIHVGAALAQLGQRVLMIDLSPQGDASCGLGVNRTDVRQGTAELLFGFCDVRRSRVKTAIDGLDLIPASDALVGAEIELCGHPYRELRLREALRTAVGAYDTVLLDCPPSLGLLTVNALCAATGVIIPLPGDFFAMSALRDTLLAVRAVQRGLNRHLERSGVLLTLADPDCPVSSAVGREARALLGDEVLSTEIPRDISLVEASSFGLPLSLHDPTAPGAEAYADLAQELLHRRNASLAPVAAQVAS